MAYMIKGMIYSFTVDDNIDIKSMDQELKDESNDEEFAALADWSKTVLGSLVKEVTMTSKLEKQPAMVTVWGLGATRQFLKFQQMVMGSIS